MATVQLLLDGADAATATTVLGYAEGLVAQQSVTIRAAQSGGPAAARIRFEPRVWYNPELRSTNFLVPGLMGFILMLTAVLSTAVVGRAREGARDDGTAPRHLASSGRASDREDDPVFVDLASSATAIILLAARVLFGVAVRGSYVDLFVATFVYLIGALGLGLLVSSMSKSQAMAFQVGSLMSMLPAIFLSGFIFPIRSMPHVLQLLTYAVPARYFLVISRGIILKGAPLSAFSAISAFLLLYGVVVLAIAWNRLVKAEL